MIVHEEYQYFQEHEVEKAQKPILNNGQILSNGLVDVWSVHTRIFENFLGMNISIRPS